MGKDTASWFHQQCPPHQAPSLNCTNVVPDSTWPKVLPDCANPTRLVSNETIPGYAGSKSSHSKTGLANGPQGWFYGLPRYRQALTHIPDCAPKELNAHPEGYNGDITSEAASRPPEKKFIVFDHSGNQTRLIYSPGTDYPNQCPVVQNPIAFDNHSLQIEEWRIKNGLLYGGSPVSFNGIDEKREYIETVEESEMHEDTEELNALLYSDEEDEWDCECDEEVSTGHSPSKMTSHIKLEKNASAEEVASSGGCHPKRKRLHDEEYSASSLVDTASSGKPSGSSESEDDAESSCGGSRFDSLPVNKRLKREKIRETVNILQDIIPGGKDMDAIYVLDEAIQYLRSLKLKAKSNI
ncbi:hypothetical protein AQUCO_01500203v1 [Aquilegia coerulea]|uniref:BHLH domain-containing protein n=1 Tax=Aquilegia coerulea TaxID=218851 RepID=A0A2G5DSJ9_AQUCA|nr:hypothetical protein AQUCO_01500203v1 [Aquilegia coerulea]